MMIERQAGRIEERMDRFVTTHDSGSGLFLSKRTM